MNKTPIRPPTREDMIIFQGFQRAIVEKKAFIKIDFKHLNKFKSPFFNPWENVLPLLFVLIVSLIVMIFKNLILGTIILAFFSIGYTFIMPYFLEPFMHNRVVKRIVPRIEKFLIAWRYGGIKIVMTADEDYYCAAPFGDWKAFIGDYFPDLIPQNLAKKEDETDV